MTGTDDFTLAWITAFLTRDGALDPEYLRGPVGQNAAQGIFHPKVDTTHPAVRQIAEECERIHGEQGAEAQAETVAHALPLSAGY